MKKDKAKKRIYDDVLFSDNPTRDELLKHVEKDLIPEKEEDQIRYLEALKKAGVVSGHIPSSLKGKEKVSFSFSSRDCASSRPQKQKKPRRVIDHHSDVELDNDKVQGKLVELSNFHLGLDGDSDDWIEKEEGSTHTIPFNVGAGFNDITISSDKLLGKYKHTSGGSIPVEEYPLRKDGTSKEKKDSKYYGAEWVGEYNAAQEAIQQDPDYQFLFELAGATNTTVERLYDVDDIEIREMRARIIAQQEREKTEKKFQRFRENASAIKDLTQKLETEEEKLDSVAEFVTEFAHISMLLDEVASSYREFTESTWQVIFIDYIIELFKPVRKGFNYDAVTNGMSDDEKAQYANYLKYAIGTISAPWTTHTFIEDYMKGDSTNITTSAAEPLDDGVMPYSNTFDVESIKRRAAFLLNNIDSDITKSGILEYIFLFATRAYTLKPEAVGYDKGIRDALSGTEGYSVRDAFSGSYGTSMDNETIITEIKSGLNRKKASIDVERKSSLDTIKSKLNEALVVLVAKPEIQRQITKRSGSGATIGINATRSLSQVNSLSVSNPSGVFEFMTGEVMLQLNTVKRYITDIGDVTKIREEIIRLERNLDLLTAEQDTIISEDVSEPDIPYRADPSWVLRPEFTGKIRMQPIVRYAINQAYSDTIRKFLPALSTARGTSKGAEKKRTDELNKLMHDPDCRPHFIQIVAAWMARSRTMFQVRWMPDLGPEILRMVDNALSGLSYATGMPRNRNIRRPGYRGTMYSVGPDDIYQVATGLPRFHQLIS